MSKKFSIAKGLDIRELNIQMGHYIYETGETGNNQLYLFMNDETLDEFGIECSKQFSPNFFDNLEFNKLGHVSNYCGHKVFCNNDLAFGEVEIR